MQMLEPGTYNVGFPVRGDDTQVIEVEVSFDIPRGARGLAHEVYHNLIHPQETDDMEFDFTRPIITPVTAKPTPS
jgi:hypothetical protein